MTTSSPRTIIQWRATKASWTEVQHGTNLMSALSQKQTFAPQKAMSALPPIATSIAFFGMSALGQADICRTLGSRHQLGWHPQQGKVVPVAAHIRVGGREHAERIVL